MRTFALLTCLFLTVSCSDQLIETDCPDLICSQEFRYLSVMFKDANGTLIAVKDFGATIERTGTSPKTMQNDDTVVGVYTVITDNDTKTLSPKGDTIRVRATHPVTNQEKEFFFVVKGGKCACHIEKVSGPEEVVFN
jgi:hypothetical protein